MVSQLLDPRQPKNLSDVFVLAVLAFLIFTLYILPQGLKKPAFALIFLFWRGCYNVGIGYLLHIQSHHRRLVAWAKKTSIFVNPNTGKNPRPWFYNLVKKELETKIPEDYEFEKAPIEYNTWLVFRRVVDLILMCDFVSYCLFAIACGSRPVGESFLMAATRWTTGIALVGFNLWVKLDAHRVVKDYAWYWGDFFYLIDQELTFDGVFEMAPHPMYSVGYAGYYGISMMAASYNVLFISIIAHAAQFIFLVYVENPHIEKTYNPPPPRKREEHPTVAEIEQANANAANIEGLEHRPQPQAPILPGKKPLAVHNLMGISNIDLFRITDISVILLQAYVIIIAAVTPTTPIWQALFILNALGWRLWFTVGLGFVLNRQSRNKMWTRHFVKYGESTEEAWRQWKGMYHLSMTMCYASFIAAAYKMYSFPEDWGYGLVLLKHVLGAGLITLQVWTAISVYDSLGEFGWFFGDFFFDQPPKLNYSGIYRFLNNPERIIGLAGVWGAVLITWSRAMFFIALLSHVGTVGFIQFVEKPHMQKLYGRKLRTEAGLSKSIRRSLPPPLKKWQGSVDKVLNETAQFIEDFLESARPIFSTGISSVYKDTTTLFSQYPARLTLTQITPDLAGFDPRDYSVTIEGTPSASEAAGDRSTGKEGGIGQFPQERTDAYKPLILEYGAPIKVTWTAPVNHSKGDWVGLYMIADNQSRQVTHVSSAGRWVATVPNEYESSPADKGILVTDQLVSGASRKDGSKADYVRGEMVFEGDKLWWTQGVFEFRYHHDGKHNVMAISLPFEIRIGRFDEEDLDLSLSNSHLILSAVEQALLPVVRNCFDRDLDIAPNTVEESFGSLVERDAKYSKRVVFAVHQMFGIEFARGVVLADGNVRKLAWRICNAKQVLVGFRIS